MIRTVETAGRTVLFSAATVGVSLAALLVFPLYFLRSFAYAGIAVVAVASIGAVVVLPALLAVLGRRVNSLDVRRAVLHRFGREPHQFRGDGPEKCARAGQSVVEAARQGARLNAVLAPECGLGLTRDLLW